MPGTDAVTRRALSRRRLVQGAAAGLALPAVAGVLPGLREARVVSAQADAKTLTIALDASPSDLDPHAANDYHATMPIRGAYEQLLTLKGSSTTEYEGLIAESWAPNDDMSVWTFKLRPNVTFQDGTPCDAEAVRQSFARLLALGLGPAYEIGRFVSDPEMVKAPDPTTVVFDCGKPQPLLPAGLASVYGGQIVNAKLAKTREADGDWGRNAAQVDATGLGTGPYRIVEYEPEQRVVLEKWDGYWRGWEGNHFDRVVIRVVPEADSRRQLIERGEIDLLNGLSPEAVDALAQFPDLTVDRSYSTETLYLILTVAGPLEKPEARQAMNYAFPYDEVVEGVYRGTAKRSIGPVAELTRGFAPETFTYPTDLAKAKELFAKAGVPEGTSFSLLAAAGDPNQSAMLQLFQANLRKIGMDLDIQEVDNGSFVGVMFRDVEPSEQPNVMPWAWSPAYNDAWDHLQLQVLCGARGSAGTNGGWYCNPKVDDLMAQAKDAPDEAASNLLLAEVQEILSKEDPPAIYYLQRQWTTVLRKDVQGFAFNPINIGTFNFWDLSRS